MKQPKFSDVAKRNYNFLDTEEKVRNLREDLHRSVQDKYKEYARNKRCFWDSGNLKNEGNMERSFK